MADETSPPDPAAPADPPAETPEPEESSARRELEERLRQQGEQIRTLSDALRRTAGMGELTSELARRGVIRVQQAAELLADRIDVELDGATPLVHVLDENRQPRVGADGGPVSVSALVEQWLAENPHFLPPSGDAGSGARRYATPPAGPSLEQLDADPQSKARFVAAHGVEALVRLARRSGSCKM